MKKKYTKAKYKKEGNLYNFNNTNNKGDNNNNKNYNINPHYPPLLLNLWFRRLSQKCKFFNENTDYSIQQGSCHTDVSS
jgi:hypothetical protein